MKDRTTVTRFIGAVLLAGGGILLALSVLGIGLESAVAVLGLAFLAAWIRWRVYGFLVPACLLLGLGIGLVVWLTGDGHWAWVLVFSGLGFLMLFVVSATSQGANVWNWWPTVPGAVLLVLGLALLGGSLLRWWPVALVLAGLGLLAGGLRGRRSHRSDQWEILD